MNQLQAFKKSEQRKISQRSEYLQKLLSKHSGNNQQWPQIQNQLSLNQQLHSNLDGFQTKKIRNDSIDKNREPSLPSVFEESSKINSFIDFKQAQTLIEQRKTVNVPKINLLFEDEISPKNVKESQFRNNNLKSNTSTNRKNDYPSYSNEVLNTKRVEYPNLQKLKIQSGQEDQNQYECPSIYKKNFKKIKQYQIPQLDVLASLNQQNTPNIHINNQTIFNKYQHLNNSLDTKNRIDKRNKYVKDKFFIIDDEILNMSVQKVGKSQIKENDLFKFLNKDQEREVVSQFQQERLKMKQRSPNDLEQFINTTQQQQNTTLAQSLFSKIEKRDLDSQWKNRFQKFQKHKVYSSLEQSLQLGGKLMESELQQTEICQLDSNKESMHQSFHSSLAKNLDKRPTLQFQQMEVLQQDESNDLKDKNVSFDKNNLSKGEKSNPKKPFEMKKHPYIHIPINRNIVFQFQKDARIANLASNHLSRQNVKDDIDTNLFQSKSSNEFTDIQKSGLNSSYVARNSKIQKNQPHLIINKINDAKNKIEKININNIEEQQDDSSIMEYKKNDQNKFKINLQNNYDKGKQQLKNEQKVQQETKRNLDLIKERLEKKIIFEQLALKNNQTFQGPFVDNDIKSIIRNKKKIRTQLLQQIEEVSKLIKNKKRQIQFAQSQNQQISNEKENQIKIFQNLIKIQINQSQNISNNTSNSNSKKNTPRQIQDQIQKQNIELGQIIKNQLLQKIIQDIQEIPQKKTQLFDSEILEMYHHLFITDLNKVKQKVQSDFQQTLQKNQQLEKEKCELLNDAQNIKKKINQYKRMIKEIEDENQNDLLSPKNETRYSSFDSCFSKDSTQQIKRSNRTGDQILKIFSQSASYEVNTTVNDIFSRTQHSNRQSLSPTNRDLYIQSNKQNRNVNNQSFQKSK